MNGALPEIRYADGDGVSIAYSVSGHGPVDLVCVPDAATIGVPPELGKARRAT